MNDLTAVSLFAGIGGIDRALELAGVAVTAAVEIDSDCRGILRRHLPGTAIFNDVTEVTGDQLRAAGFVPRRGILAGGFPCQDLSVAGRRAGLGGARSGLFWHIMRLADELRPRWLLLENVPGLLSAVCPCPGDGACVAGRRAVACGEWRGDRDTREWFPDVPHGVSGGACPGGCMASHGGAMGTVLGALGERGYGFAYRVLDAQHFGVPQRRRRVFIAGCLGDRAAPVQVLLEPEGGAGDSAAGGQARPGAAGAPEGGADGPVITGTLTTGMMADYDDNTARGGFMIAHSTGAGWWTEGPGTLRAQGGGTDLGGHLVTHAITAREGKGPDSDATNGFIAVPVAWRGRDGGSQLEAAQDGEPMFALRASQGGGTGGLPMVATSVSNDSAPVVGHDQIGALKPGTGLDIPSVPAVMAFNPQTGGDMRLGYGEMPTALQANQVTAVHVATNWQGGSNQDQIIGPESVSPTLAHSSATHSGHHEPKVLIGDACGVSENQRGEVLETPYSHQLTTGGGKPGQGYGAVRQESAVRRLTPMECERLQGFPDGWTRLQADGTEQSDSTRYRQLGNAVAVPVVAWIIRRIAAAERSAALDAEGAA